MPVRSTLTPKRAIAWTEVHRWLEHMPEPEEEQLVHLQQQAPDKIMNPCEISRPYWINAFKKCRSRMVPF